MGIIKRGILGGFQKKVANVVGSSWKGIAYMKSLPISVANPRTAPQVAQRNRFKKVSKVGSLLLAEIIKPLWDRFAQQASGYNDFVQKNITLFDTGAPNPPEDLVTSQGQMAKTELGGLVVAAGDPNVTVQWADDSGSGFKLADDTCFVVFYNLTKTNPQGFNTGVRRDAETADIVLNSPPDAPDDLAIYLSFRRADGTIVSDNSVLLTGI